MSKDWRIILRFAVVGLAVAAIFCAFFRIDSRSESWTTIWIFWASVVICPAWFFVFVVVVNAAELPVPDSRLVWLIIGLVNCLYYASIGAVYIRFRSWRAGTARV